MAGEPPKSLRHWTKPGASTWGITLAIALIYVLGFSAQAAWALPPPGVEPQDTCTPEADVLLPDLRVLLQGVSGEATAGSFVRIVASPKLRVISAHCTVSFQFLPNGDFDWTLSKQPIGSRATLYRDATYEVVLPLDQIGNYRVQFTACVKGCTLLIGDTSTSATSLSRSTDISPHRIMAMAPQSTPVLPPSAVDKPTLPTESNGVLKCRVGGSVASLPSNEWVTVEDQGSYRRLDGVAMLSNVASTDDFRTHDSHDAEFRVRPDPEYQYLLGADNNPLQTMLVEWEYPTHPENVWPTPGDRVTALGWWIHDCGHQPLPTEIHPAWGIAVQRQRPIRLPDQTFSLAGVESKLSDTPRVYVPGIQTRVYFNENAGEVYDCSHGLHRPYELGVAEGVCIHGPSQIHQKFEFDIYLPPSPQSLELAAGIIHPPPTPLYISALGQPKPLVSRHDEGQQTYLHVVLPLQNLTASKYEAAISAAWVYPSPENWNLRAWRLSLNWIYVDNDGDSPDFRLCFPLLGCSRPGGGDWRFWVDTNNIHPEWIRLIRCADCIQSGETVTEAIWDDVVRRAPWETGNGGTLGPDVLVFPSGSIFFQTSGFESDGLHDEPIGQIIARLPQVQQPYVMHETGSSPPHGSYNVDFEVIGEPTPELPALTAAAEDFYRSYLITSADLP